jgi:SIR2-like domain
VIDWPEDVIDAIARRRCAIVIGSGVSANSRGTGDVRPPTWKSFLVEGCERQGNPTHILDALNQNDMLEACDYLKSSMGNQWSVFLREKFSTPRYRPAEIHTQLLELDTRIVISLNFDKIYDNFANSRTEGTVIVKNYYDDDIREAVSGSDRYVIKPHGTIDSTKKIIFTLDDYAKARIEFSSFYEVLNALLHTHLLLFIGCGLSDPDLKTLFEEYRYRYQEMPHYITLPGPISPEKEDLVKRTRGMNILQYNNADDHIELTKSLEELVGHVAHRREIIARELSW